MPITTTITVTNRVHGFHRWPSAPHEVAYLADTHRHEFVFRTTVRVHHDDRDVEFHMLQAQVQEFFATAFESLKHGLDFGDWSCEKLGRVLGGYLRDGGVDVQTVSVFEDDENGATVTFVALDAEGML